MKPIADQRGPPWRFRFGLWTLVIVTTLFSITAAVAGALLREGFNRPPSASYVLAATAAPLGLVVILGIGRWCFEQVARFRHARSRRG